MSAGPPTVPLCAEERDDALTPDDGYYHYCFGVQGAEVVGSILHCAFCTDQPEPAPAPVSMLDASTAPACLAGGVDAGDFEDAEILRAGRALGAEVVERTQRALAARAWRRP